jgi:hypothetical protein
MQFETEEPKKRKSIFERGDEPVDHTSLLDAVPRWMTITYVVIVLSLYSACVWALVKSP